MLEAMSQTILYVEVNPDDQVLLELAFRKAGVEASLEAATTGDQAIAWLQTEAEAAAPACVLLDVKLPGLSGLQVLSWIRSQPALKRLPVVMLSSSLLPGDINQAYDLGANSYLAKPAGLPELISLAKTIDLYWLRCNLSPIPDSPRAKVFVAQSSCA